MSHFLKKDILKQTESHIQKLLDGEGSGHDWWHIHRVRNTSKKIATVEGADLYIVELAALLHDIADHKFHDGDETIGPKIAGDWLQSLNVANDDILHVQEIIRDLSFKGANVDTPMKTIEGQCVQDADRLDAMGAIGIARAFAFGGHKSRALHDPNSTPTMHNSFDAYKNDEGPTIHHFYEKLLLLKDRMNTNYGKQLANERHTFMEQYLSRFFSEWKGEQ